MALLFLTKIDKDAVFAVAKLITLKLHTVLGPAAKGMKANGGISLIFSMLNRSGSNNCKFEFNENWIRRYEAQRCSNDRSCD